MTSADFYSEWDQIIKNWYTDKSALSSLMDKRNSLSLEHVPEPYYGDMDNCSIVIVNMNPGVGLQEQSWYNQDLSNMMVNIIKNSSYSSFVKDFPLLRGVGPTPSVNWWKSRKEWIDRILNVKGVSCSKKMPFAIELVPLHSKSFNVSNTSAYVDMIRTLHPKLDIIDAIENAIHRSDAKMGLAVGKPICKVLLKNGFQCFCGSLEDPIQPDSMKSRFYCVIGKERPEILCTWHDGGNRAPAQSFAVHEESIIKNCFR